MLPLDNTYIAAAGLSLMIAVPSSPLSHVGATGTIAVSAGEEFLSLALQPCSEPPQATPKASLSHWFNVEAA